MGKNDDSKIIKPADWTVPDTYSPLEPLDEFMIHNSIEPVARYYTTDLRAYDRMWFIGQDLGGDVYFMTGIGFYPNLRTADAYAQVNYKGNLTYIHAHRSLGDNRMNMNVGPITFEIIEPFKEWRLSLEENKFGISFDLRFYDTKQCRFGVGSLAGFAGTSPKIHHEPVAGYSTFGNVDGWVNYHGETIQLNTATSNGSRDHHWGVREGVGGKERSRQGDAFLGQQGNHPLGGQWVEFDDWCIWFASNLPNIGDDRPVNRLMPVEYRLKFDDETKMFTEGIITNQRENGEKVEMHYRQIGNQIVFLRCGMYGTHEGGTPDDNLWWGADVGDHIGGGVHDVNKPENRILLCGGNEHLCEVSCGDETTIGYLELWEPLAYEFCRDQLFPGWKLLEG